MSETQQPAPAPQVPMILTVMSSVDILAGMILVGFGAAKSNVVLLAIGLVLLAAGASVFMITAARRRQLGR